MQIGLLEAAGLRECTDDKETAALQAASQNLYLQHDDKTRESRPGSPLPSIQNGTLHFLPNKGRAHPELPG